MLKLKLFSYIHNAQVFVENLLEIDVLVISLVLHPDRHLVKKLVKLRTSRNKYFQKELKSMFFDQYTFSILWYEYESKDTVPHFLLHTVYPTGCADP